MTIDELNALTALTAGDEIPVWDAEASGEPTKKITAQNMANSVKTLANLQGTLTFDTTPTTGSTNPVTSGGIKTAMANSQLSSVIDLSMFTSIDSHVNTDSFFRLRVGNVVYLSIRLDFSVATTISGSGIKLFDINSSIAPRQQILVSPIVSSSGSLITSASVWLEANSPRKVTLYGTSLPNGTFYCNLTYLM